ncbi:hypothetical protein BD779DRAFT_1471634 [Infundibulicybe gibba]|nr:hypothetical protein BD779DRAFT_1471634 [Infundibulicybe gibba]
MNAVPISVRKAATVESWTDTNPTLCDASLACAPLSLARLAVPEISLEYRGYRSPQIAGLPIFEEMHFVIERANSSGLMNAGRVKPAIVVKCGIAAEMAGGTTNWMGSENILDPDGIRLTRPAIGSRQLLEKQMYSQPGPRRESTKKKFESDAVVIYRRITTQKRDFLDIRLVCMARGSREVASSDDTVYSGAGATTIFVRGDGGNILNGGGASALASNSLDHLPNPYTVGIDSSGRATCPSTLPFSVEHGVSAIRWGVVEHSRRIALHI